jgi:hypothetical protein
MGLHPPKQTIEYIETSHVGSASTDKAIAVILKPFRMFVTGYSVHNLPYQATQTDS